MSSDFSARINCANAKISLGMPQGIEDKLPEKLVQAFNKRSVKEWVCKMVTAALSEYRRENMPNMSNQSNCVVGQ